MKLCYDNISVFVIKTFNFITSSFVELTRIFDYCIIVCINDTLLITLLTEIICGLGRS